MSDFLEGAIGLEFVVVSLISDKGGKMFATGKDAVNFAQDGLVNEFSWMDEVNAIFFTSLHLGRRI